MLDARDLNTLDKDALIGVIRKLETRILDESQRCQKREQLMNENKQAAMSQMVAAIAHRWRQPLTVIGFILQNIQGAFETGKLDQDYLYQSVESGMTQIKILSDTIDDLRDYLKPLNERKCFDVATVLTDTFSLLNSQLQNNMIRLDMDISSGSGATTVGLISQFKLVLINIVNNGITAIKKKIQRGAMKKGDGRLTVGLTTGNDTIDIEIGNNGDAIPGELLDRIFEPLFATDENSPSKGVGLYLAKTIIEGNMHGKISVRNLEDRVVFTIRLNRWRKE